MLPSGATVGPSVSPPLIGASRVNKSSSLAPSGMIGLSSALAKRLLPPSQESPSPSTTSVSFNRLSFIVDSPGLNGPPRREVRQLHGGLLCHTRHGIAPGG